MVPENAIPIAVLAGAGASCFAELPTVLSFFKRVEWPEAQALDATCQELARRISIFEGTRENQAWPEFDAEKLFGWLECKGGIAQHKILSGYGSKRMARPILDWPTNSMQLAPGYRLSPFPTESLRWRCSLDPPLPIERRGRWAWRVLGSGCGA